jgi:formylmethanofuran dehydrogenase subunit E
MGRKVANHLHLYKKINLARKKGKEPFFVFKCMKPACSHYIPLHLAEGKLCECNRCGEPMILNKESMTLTVPHCSNCVKRKKSDEVSAIAEFLAKPII